MKEDKKINEILAERGKSYGSFKDNSEVAIRLFELVRNSTLPFYITNGFYQIFSKISRLVSGDVNHLDSYKDITGYAKLMLKHFREEVDFSSFCIEKPSIKFRKDYDKILSNGVNYSEFTKNQKDRLNRIIDIIYRFFLVKFSEKEFVIMMGNIIRLNKDLTKIAEEKKSIL